MKTKRLPLMDPKVLTKKKLWDTDWLTGKEPKPKKR